MALNYICVFAILLDLFVMFLAARTSALAYLSASCSDSIAYDLDGFLACWFELAAHVSNKVLNKYSPSKQS